MYNYKINPADLAGGPDSRILQQLFGALRTGNLKSIPGLLENPEMLMNEVVGNPMSGINEMLQKGGNYVGGGLKNMGKSLSNSGKGMEGMLGNALSSGGKGIQNAGKFISKNPGMSLGGAALGGLNVAGLADGEDILAQLLGGAGGAGLGFVKGGVPGAIMGGLGGGAAGDILPKLIRMLQGNNQEMNM
jgi:hypothetical protein